MKGLQRLSAIFFILLSLQSSAQVDTLKITLLQAEALFLKNNYSLVAGRYKIEQAKADVITAQLFDNPELTYENLFYNHETRKFFQTSAANGQYSGGIAQLIKLAGKRNKNIRLAETDVKLTALSYFDLLRTLKFELRNTFYRYHFASQSFQIYANQIASTNQLLTAFESQFKTGNVANKEVIRIKSLLIGLKAEQTEVLNQLDDEAKTLKTLCGIAADAPIATILTPERNDNRVNMFSYADLLDSALNNRSDLQLAKTSLHYQELHLRLQKANAIPDVELSLSYDRKGNFPEKYTGLGLKIPIPLFNRNQGEIKKAKIGIDAANQAIKQQKHVLENEVYNAYLTALRNEKLLEEIDPGFSGDFDQLMTGLLKNFRDRNISLIEFLDLYESYKETTLQLYKLQAGRYNSREELNYVTGSNIFN